MPENRTDLPGLGLGPMASGADLISAVAAESTSELTAGLDVDFRVVAAAKGRIAVRLGEVDRRQAYRDEGATSTASWVVERYGVSTATARTLTHIGEKAWDIPLLVGALCAGDVSLDKVRALADVATPETDRELLDQARECTVRELADVARSIAVTAASHSPAQSDHDRRFLRFNDQFRTMTAQLPPESYAATRACLEARARKIPTDGEAPWDHCLCDAFTEAIHSLATGSDGQSTKTGSPYVVVAHVPLAALVDDTIETTVLAGELEHHGLIDCETVQRIACDATITIAIDDDVGHTMFEGRARREPTDAQRREVMRRDRQCRFPGCTNVTFTNVHHIVPWKPGGRTDLENLALQCLYHHHLVHSNGWTMSGNANEELTFVGPTGRVMTSRPSRKWTTANAVARSGPSG